MAAILPNALVGVAVLRIASRLEPRAGPAGLVAFVLAQGGLLVLATAVATLCWLAETWLRGAALRSGWVGIASWQTLANALIQVAVAALGRTWQAAARRSSAEALRAKAELSSLRAQVNPQFFFDTLLALPGLVRSDPGRAESALERLGDLLRFGLRVHQNQIDQVAFRDEWRLVQSYVSLEQLRLAPRLTVSLRATEEVMDLPVPPFAVQPLVEDAVGRAVAPPRERGLVEVAARRTDRRLLVEVVDDGPGFPEPRGPRELRPGVRLLRDRLAALYGDRAQLALEPAAAGGCRARLDLPIEGGGDEG